MFFFKKEDEMRHMNTPNDFSQQDIALVQSLLAKNVRNLVKTLKQNDWDNERIIKALKGCGFDEEKIYTEFKKAKTDDCKILDAFLRIFGLNNQWLKDFVAKNKNEEIRIEFIAYLEEQGFSIIKMVVELTKLGWDNEFIVWVVEQKLNTEGQDDRIILVLSEAGWDNFKIVEISKKYGFLTPYIIQMLFDLGLSDQDLFSLLTEFFELPDIIKEFPDDWETARIVVFLKRNIENPSKEKIRRILKEADWDNLEIDDALEYANL